MRRRRMPGHIRPQPGGEETIDGCIDSVAYHEPMPETTPVEPVAADEWQIIETGPPMDPEQAKAWKEEQRKKRK